LLDTYIWVVGGHVHLKYTCLKMLLNYMFKNNYSF